MKNSYQFVRKSYAMQRMAESIERAIQASTSAEKERAARWAAAWVLLCGIMTATVNVRRSDVNIHGQSKASRASDQADSATRTISAAASALLHTAAHCGSATSDSVTEEFDYAKSGQHLPAEANRHAMLYSSN